MSITVGDKVKIINENAEGVVKKILSIQFVLVQVGDFDYEYSIDNLVKAGETLSPSFSKKNKKGIITSHTEKVHPSIKNILMDDSEKYSTPAVSYREIKLRKGKKSPSIREIDLHFDALPAGSSKNSTEIMTYQLKVFVNELERAISKGERQIIFIHGKGQGKLKTEIHKILSTYENIVFYEAPLKIYGGGATQVEIHKY